ncbi:MAG: DUF6502 family protein [Geminicoccaceae bacterium]
MSTEPVSAKFLHNALRRMLRPLVKALVSHGVVFPAVVELLREVYVEVVRDEFKVEGKKQTLSRISLMTGVTRRETRRLLDHPKTVDAPPHALSLGARVMTVWLGDEEFLDQQGEPLPLQLTAQDDLPSLERLVATVSKDVRARAVLDEWLRLGIVEMSGHVVRLKKSAFIPEEGYEEKIYYFGRNLRDHIASGVRNLEGKSPSLFDRAVYYDRLSKDSLEKLRRFAREEGVACLLRVNSKARELADQDEAGGGDLSGRMTLGVYYYEEVEKEKG